MGKLLFRVLVVSLLLSIISFRQKKEEASRFVAYGQEEAFNSAGSSSKPHTMSAREINSAGDVSLVALARGQEKAFSSVESGSEEHNTTAHETNYSQHLSIVTQPASSYSLEPAGSIGTETFEARTTIVQLTKELSPGNLITKKEEVGKGGFGVVYRGDYNGEEVAIKTEALSARGFEKQLVNEFNVLRVLQPLEDVESMRRVGVPKLFVDQVLVKGSELWMVTEYFGGKNLENLKGMLSDEDVESVAVILIDTLEYIHRKQYLHCDIKPENIMLAKDKHPGVFLIDFGLSRHVDDPRHGGIGSPRYMSAYAMMDKKPQSKRDDLISLLYTLVYVAKPSDFAGPRLPWQGFGKRFGFGKPFANKKDLEKAKKDLEKEILKEKVSVSMDVLCDGIPKGLKPGFHDALIYCGQLEHQQEPDYQHLRSLFHFRRGGLGFLRS